MLFASASSDAIAIIGNRCKILGLSPSFIHAAREGTCVRISGDVLVFTKREDAALEGCAKALALSGSFPSAPTLIVLPASDALSQRAALHIAPVPPALGEALSLPIPSATVKLVGASCGADLDRIAAVAAVACKLTVAEARLLPHMLRGETVAATAQLLGLRPETLRTQLKSIFQKVGVSRQTELVSYVMTAFDPCLRFSI